MAPSVGLKLSQHPNSSFPPLPMSSLMEPGFSGSLACPKWSKCYSPQKGSPCRENPRSYATTVEVPMLAAVMVAVTDGSGQCERQQKHAQPAKQV